MDGGLGPATVAIASDAGANVVVAGTAIFGAEDPKHVIQTLKERVEESLANAQT